MAQAALEDAREADAILPGRAAPPALEGRALAALGRFKEALAALEKARARDAGVLDDPQALLAWARVLAHTGHSQDSAAAYRTLLPRVSALSSAERFAATTEAGLVALACGPTTLDEAVSAFRESLRANQADAEAVAVLGLALALDRRGEGEEARALLSDHRRNDPRTALSARRVRELLAAAPSEALALTALGAEATDPTAARESWESYLASSPAGPWAAHARAHLAALVAGHSAGRGSR
jgi:tetratricopeptide (TPR) repeat protein